MWRINDWLYEIKWAWQRVVRGYDDRMTWGFCEVFPEMFIDILDHLINKRCGFPANLTDKKWDKILIEMQDGFKAMGEMDELSVDNYIEVRKPYVKRIDRGLVLFVKYFHNLWD